MSSEDLPILPPLESMEKPHGHKIIIANNNDTNLKSSMSKNKSNKNISKSHNNNNNIINHADSHKNAVENVMEELAKEHIDKTVLKPSSNFNGRPCLNMKDFFKLMTDKNKRQQNLDALYNLVENDSDSVIGFVELNGLSFIDEWLDNARKDNDHWFSLCILQFLCHKNLSITYEALQTVSIAKAVKQYISCSNSNDSSPQSIPRLTEKIKSLLPSDLNLSRANDNFIDKINRSVLHKICHQNKDIDTIRYLQSQFASRIVNKWKKFVGDWKKHNNRPNYRHVKFADEKAKQLEQSTMFSRDDAPMNITHEQDRKRRERMATTIQWYFPFRIELIDINSDDNDEDIDDIKKTKQKKFVERGRDSKEKKTQKERIMDEFDQTSIGGEPLKDPKSLPSNRQTPTSNTKPFIIPLESEVSPSPDKTINTAQPNGARLAPPQSAPHPNMAPNPNIAGPYPYPPPPQRAPPGYPPHHPNMPPLPHAMRHPPHPPYPPHGHHPPPPHLRPPPPPPGHHIYGPPPNTGYNPHIHGHPPHPQHPQHRYPPHHPHHPHVGYPHPPHPNAMRPPPVGYNGQHPPNMPPPGYPQHPLANPNTNPNVRPPPNSNTNNQPPQQATQLQQQQQQQTQQSQVPPINGAANNKQVINIPDPTIKTALATSNGKRPRRREFSDERPAKRQKIHERHYDNHSDGDRDYRRDNRRDRDRDRERDNRERDRDRKKRHNGKHNRDKYDKRHKNRRGGRRNKDGMINNNRNFVSYYHNNINNNNNNNNYDNMNHHNFAHNFNSFNNAHFSNNDFSSYNVRQISIAYDNNNNNDNDNDNYNNKYWNNYYDENKSQNEESNEYLIIYFLFAFLTFCYIIFGNKFGYFFHI